MSSCEVLVARRQTVQLVDSRQVEVRLLSWYAASSQLINHSNITTAYAFLHCRPGQELIGFLCKPSQTGDMCWCLELKMSSKSGPAVVVALSPPPAAPSYIVLVPATCQSGGNKHQMKRQH